MHLQRPEAQAASCPFRPTGQGQQPDVRPREKLRSLGELVYTPEKRRRRNREVRPIEGFQGRKSLLAQLIHPLRRGQILEAMLAEILQSIGLHERGRRGGDEHLAAVSGRCDPGGAVDVDPDVPFLGEQRRTGVHPHTHLDRAVPQRLRQVACSSKGAGRSWERSKEGVPLRIHLDAVMAEKRLSNRATVRGERLRVGLRAELMQQLG